MPEHYDDDKKERSRLPGLKPGQKLATAGPGIEAIKSAVSKTGETLFGGIAPEKRGGYRGYETGDRAGTGFMESGIPIPPDPIPPRPAMGTTVAPMMTLPDGTGGTGAGGVAAGGALPSGPLEMWAQGEKGGFGAMGEEGALPSSWDVDAANKRGMEKYGEGAYNLSPRLRTMYGDVMDKTLGPATIQPAQQGIPSGIDAPSSSGNAMVDLFRWVSHNKRVQQQNKMRQEQERLGLEAEKYAGEQDFKERKLSSEEKGREGALDLSRREAIATTAKEAGGDRKLTLEGLKEQAKLLKQGFEAGSLQGEEYYTKLGNVSKQIAALEGRGKKETKQRRPNTLQDFIAAARKNPGNKDSSDKELEAYYNETYGG